MLAREIRRPLDPAILPSGSPCILLILALVGSPVIADQVPVGEFSARGLAQWDQHDFSGKTEYRLIQRQGEQRVRAESRGGATALFREIQVDIRRTPYLNWRWKVDKGGIIPNVDERTKSGDDYPARIYVVARTGILPWQTKAVNYVWSNNQTTGQRWPSAFTDSSLMIAVRSGVRETGVWVEEKRNVHEDFEQFLGESVDSIELIAVMSDSDQTGIPVAAEYGDIYFSQE